MVRLLLYHGANLNLSSNGGSTPQSIAKRCGHFDVLKALEEVCQHYSNDSLLRSNECGDLSCVHRKIFSDAEEQSTPLTYRTVIAVSVDHPGAGSYVIDNAISPTVVKGLLKLWKDLPIDESNKKKNSTLCSVRSYYCDAEDYVGHVLSSVIIGVGLAPSRDQTAVFPHMRFLNYAEEGIVLAPHVDLCRVDAFSGRRSTHSFLLYLTDCKCGGETSLLQDLSGEGRNHVLASISPKRGRLLLFPHACPHEGNRVDDVPKILLRGEVRLNNRNL